jgi:hypothetical protein
MLIDEMKIFFHQTLLSVTNTLKQSADEESMTKEIVDF